MITRQTKLFYFVGDTPYASLEEAQKADLLKLIPAQYKDGTSMGDRQRLAEWMVEFAEAITVILTATARSRIRKPRKDKGVPRKKDSAKINAALQDVKQ